MDKHWSDAKIPKWVTESIEKDLRDFKLTNALSWPTETKPEPLPFRWGDYDRLYGEPVAGTYWGLVGRDRSKKVSIRERQEGEEGWKDWRFDTGRGFQTIVCRGPLFETQRDADLYILWEQCERFAEELMQARARVYDR